MSRRTYRICKYCGDTHEVGNWPHNCQEPFWDLRSDFPSPAIVSDSLPGGVNGLYHHAALRKIDSKSAYRRATKQFGCVEMGNEYAAATKAREDRGFKKDSIESAVNDALHRHGVSSDSDMSKVNYGS